MTVVSVRYAPPGWENNPRFAYIGRAGRNHDGFFGNPVEKGKPCPECGQTHQDGGSTLPCYEKILRRRLQDDVFRRRFLTLDGLTQVCFCAGPQGLTLEQPMRCHGQVNIKLLNELLGR